MSEAMRRPGLFRMLLQRYGPVLRHRERHELLCSSCRYGSLEVTRSILQNWHAEELDDGAADATSEVASATIPEESVGLDVYQPLHIAAACGHISILQELLPKYKLQELQGHIHDAEVNEKRFTESMEDGSDESGSETSMSSDVCEGPIVFEPFMATVRVREALARLLAERSSGDEMGGHECAPLRTRKRTYAAT
uniref:Uncharacterized protein n=1 Tax=Eutreptiella gymnastica TaxID=73025 RepID=A0A7S4FF24_9EUGL